MTEMYFLYNPYLQETDPVTLNLIQTTVPEVEDQCPTLFAQFSVVSVIGELVNKLEKLVHLLSMF